MLAEKRPAVIILNGFLGSGKTTLFRKLLVQAQQKNIAVNAIVNEMSTLDIDGELIGNMDIVEHNEGIFSTIYGVSLCSQTGLAELDKNLKKLLTQNHPQLIIIETSGSTHPLPLIEYFKTQTRVQLTGVLTLVDSLMLAHDYQNGQNLIPVMQQNIANNIRDTTNLLVEQMLFCSHLFFSKTDRITEQQLNTMASCVQQINPMVSAHALQFGNLAIEALLELEGYDYQQVSQLITELKPIVNQSTDQSESDPYNMVSSVIKDERPFHPQRLWQTCNAFLGDKIYRSKGFFWLASRDKYALIWNQAAGSINLEINGSWRAGVINSEDHGLTQQEINHLKQQIADKGRFGDRCCELTVIGDKTQVAEFTTALKQCFLTEEEIQQWFAGEEFEDPWPKNIVRHGMGA